jgi:hypothetical protein
MYRPLEALDGDLLDVPHNGGWVRVSHAADSTVSVLCSRSRWCVRSRARGSGHGGGVVVSVNVSLRQDRPAHDALRDAPSCQAMIAVHRPFRPTAFVSTSAFTMYLVPHNHIHNVFESSVTPEYSR